MNEAHEKRDTPETLVLIEKGEISKVTRGNAFLWPMYEQGVPPFNHWCPIC